MPRTLSPWGIEFHHKHGRFIKLSKTDSRATREGDTYDHGVVFSRRPLKIGEIFQLKIEQMETKWAGSLVSLTMLCFSKCLCQNFAW